MYFPFYMKTRKLNALNYYLKKVWNYLFLLINESKSSILYDTNIDCLFNSKTVLFIGALYILTII